MEKEAPFKGMSYGPRLFHKPLKVYGEDVKLEAVMLRLFVENTERDQIQYHGSWGSLQAIESK